MRFGLFLHEAEIAARPARHPSVPPAPQGTEIARGLCLPYFVAAAYLTAENWSFPVSQPQHLIHNFARVV